MSPGASEEKGSILLETHKQFMKFRTISRKLSNIKGIPVPQSKDNLGSFSLLILQQMSPDLLLPPRFPKGNYMFWKKVI